MIFSYFLYFCSIIFFLLFLILFIWVPWLEACQFCLSFKEDQVFSIVFLWSLFPTFTLFTFIFTSFLLTVGFVCSFSNSWDGRLHCLRFFLFFWERLVLLWTSLSEVLLLHSIGFLRLCFHCHLSQGIFWFPLRFHHWPIGVFFPLVF